MNRITTKPGTIVVVSLAMALAALAMGCKGGGTGSRDPILGGNGSAALAPLVIAVTPANNAVSVPTSTLVTATFNEPMAPISGGATFTVTCAAPGVDPAGTVTLNAAGTIATFAPSAALAPLTVYTATVTGAAALSTGLVLASPYRWQFTTPAPPAPPAPPPRPGRAREAGLAAERDQPGQVRELRRHLGFQQPHPPRLAGIVGDEPAEVGQALVQVGPGLGVAGEEDLVAGEQVAAHRRFLPQHLALHRADLVLDPERVDLPGGMLLHPLRAGRQGPQADEGQRQGHRERGHGDGLPGQADDPWPYRPGRSQEPLGEAPVGVVRPSSHGPHPGPWFARPAGQPGPGPMATGERMTTRPISAPPLPQVKPEHNGCH